jgi:hypothetical protein
MYGQHNRRKAGFPARRNKKASKSAHKHIFLVWYFALYSYCCIPGTTTIGHVLELLQIEYQLHRMLRGRKDLPPTFIVVDLTLPKQSLRASE